MIMNFTLFTPPTPSCPANINFPTPHSTFFSLLLTTTFFFLWLSPDYMNWTLNTAYYFNLVDISDHSQKVDVMGKTGQREAADSRSGSVEPETMGGSDNVDNPVVTTTSDSKEEPQITEPIQGLTLTRSNLLKVDSSDLSRPSTPEAPIVGPKKKRLTLQERLALAAKGKKKITTNVDNETNSDQNEASNKSSPAPESEVPKSIEVSESEDHNKKIVETKLPVVIDPSSKERIEALEKSLREAETRLKATENSQETIKQLIKEGEVLSKKELKLNDAIKKLKTANLELEELLLDSITKNSESAIQIEELHDFLRIQKVSSLEQLMERFSELKSYKDDAERANSWEIQYRLQLKLYEEEVKLKKALQKQLQELTIQKEMSFKQSQLDSEQHKSLCDQLKEQIGLQREQHNKEIGRLEAKIEELRLDKETTRQSEKSDLENVNGDLPALHFQLQQQYLSSQENFKAIEASLQKKIEQLTLSLESMKASKNRAINDMKKVQAELVEYVKKNGELEAQVHTLTLQNDELIFDCDNKETLQKEVEERFETFKQIYNNDRTTLNAKIEKLTEDLEAAKGTNSISPRRIPSNLELNLDSHSFNRLLSDVKFGESCTTPYLLRDTSSMNFSPSQVLISTANGEEIEPDEDPISLNDRNNSYNSVSAGNGTSGMNFQLINRMSSTIRRLEIELNTLRSENIQMNGQIELAQQQILELSHFEDEKNRAQDEIAQLEEELSNTKAKERTMLEIMGEKSDQIEELKADVMDLKELLKLQVQQLVELKAGK